MACTCFPQLYSKGQTDELLGFFSVAYIPTRFSTRRPQSMLRPHLPDCPKALQPLMMPIETLFSESRANYLATLNKPGKFCRGLHTHRDRFLQWGYAVL
jgi:hypothetical protein